MFKRMKIFKMWFLINFYGLLFCLQKQTIPAYINPHKPNISTNTGTELEIFSRRKFAVYKGIKF